MANVKEEEGTLPVGMHTFRPFLLEYCLMSELREVERRRIPGMYVMPSATSPLVWFGVLIVRFGFYAGGIFKFLLIANDDHPHGGVVPVIVFQPPVFHPLVDMVTGQMNCGSRFKKWKAQTNSIAELLEFVKDTFDQVITDGAVNPEASSIHATNKDSFKQRAAESVQYCRSRLLDNSPTSRLVSSDISQDVDGLAFPTSLLEGVLLNDAKRNMMESSPIAACNSANGDCTLQSSGSGSGGGDDDSDTSSTTTQTGEEATGPAERQRPLGLSWVKPGTATPFSADNART